MNYELDAVKPFFNGLVIEDKEMPEQLLKASKVAWLRLKKYFKFISEEDFYLFFPYAFSLNKTGKVVKNHELVLDKISEVIERIKKSNVILKFEHLRDNDFYLLVMILAFELELIGKYTFKKKNEVYDVIGDHKNKLEGNFQLLDLIKGWDSGKFKFESIEIRGFNHVKGKTPEAISAKVIDEDVFKGIVEVTKSKLKDNVIGMDYTNFLRTSYVGGGKLKGRIFDKSYNDYDLFMQEFIVALFDYGKKKNYYDTKKNYYELMHCILLVLNASFPKTRPQEKKLKKGVFKDEKVKSKKEEARVSVCDIDSASLATRIEGYFKAGRKKYSSPISIRSRIPTLTSIS